MNPIESRIRGFLDEQFPGAGAAQFGQSLLESGLIDSIGVLALVTWLEEHFGFVIDDADVLPENLDSVGALVAFVERKCAEAGQPA